MPVKVILEDQAVPDIHAVADLILANVTGATKTMIQGDGHVIGMEKPDEFKKVVTEFLYSLKNNES